MMGVWMLVVTSLLARGTHAYAPIQMLKGPAKGVVVLSRSFPTNVRGDAPAQKLMISDQPDSFPPSMIPYFSPRLDHTITWDEMDWCLEADGHKRGDTVGVNRCSSGANQKWSWLPNGQGNMIQLQDTNLCLNVADTHGHLSGAPIDLQECRDQVTSTWMFEGKSVPFPTSSQGEIHWEDARHAMLYLTLLSLIGALSLSTWLWRRERKAGSALMSQASTPLNVDHGGVSLTARLGTRQDSAPLIAKFDGSMLTMVPAVMLQSAKPVAENGSRSRDVNMSTEEASAGPESSKEFITPRSEDFSKWFLDVIRECELADYGPARGTMVIRPYGFAMWETTQNILNEQFRSRGVENCYFPQLIPYSFITKEASHVEGFAPELAVVTQGGGKTLEEPLVVRPTSETIVNHMLSKWISSYRDLPIKLNQWCNVHRWELRTKPFIRTLEFLWQEGHTAHATSKEANAMAMDMIKVYAEFAEETCAMPVVVGKKSSIESFAGAKATFTMEAMMGDKRALQAGTSHDLGSNFAKAFDTTFSAQDGKDKHVFQSSWGVSTRLLGGVIMTHGDDKGLTLPPKLAPIQVIVTPIWRKDKEKDSVMQSCDEVVQSLKDAGVRVKIDADERKSPGWKFNFWEMKGVPIRIEIGPRDVEKNACVVARRDVPGKEGKEFGVSAEKESLVQKIATTLDEIHNSMLEKARAFRDENIVDCATMADLEATIEEGKWARCPWEGSDEDEKAIKEKMGATIRCIPFEQPATKGACIQTGQDARRVCIFAKSY